MHSSEVVVVGAGLAGLACALRLAAAGVEVTVLEQADAAGDAAAQARQVLENVRAALERAGARLEHVVRTRIYVRNVGDWEAIGRVHGEYFGAIRPASTMVEVSGLVDPEMLVEIEVDAYVTD